ncbi:hypothetical protein FPQ18DRAFT_313862 [Pyronema domesticum]|uniref:Similar to SAYSvFN domain-containing protein 1 acc. no. Q9NPB0 n=1 Tax=Pyronema omphalodes (strain CBS 100304) TaxID=1076935 RepID=U4LHP5_PYROM|nr:hypothetical protein FPQ18DRAFT_313862 [Pyronema domesticum]CCX31443.1 Similar to SAYSvFN domain-containing protein 1; acc. no. Q9NPB0 [Pyronema omphalodes CBS 100304]
MSKPSRGNKKDKRDKKPFHIRKEELALDEYKQELREKSPSDLARRAVDVLKTSRQFHLYVLLQILAAYFGFGQFLLCIGLLWMFYVNTSVGGRKPGEKSAYSIFNKNAEAIDGATQMDYLEREMRRQLY